MKKPSKTRFCSFPELIDNIWTLEVDSWFPYKNPATQMPPTIMNVILSDSIGAVVLRLNEWPEIPREENASWVEDAESLYMSWSELRIRVVGHLLIFSGFAMGSGIYNGRVVIMLLWNIILRVGTNTKDTGNERFRTRQTSPENLSS